MSRTKTVFRSSEITHIWANKRAPFGRSPSNISFNGDVIYSYSTAIARHIEFKGKPAVIFNETSYSSTTSGAQSGIRRAIPSHLPVFSIGDLQRGTELHMEGGQALFEWAINQAAYYQAKASRARQYKEQHLGNQARWLEKAKEINEFFELGQTVDEETITRLAETKAKAEAEERAQQKARDAQRRKEHQENFDAWLRGENVPLYYSAYSAFPTAFRIEDRELVSTLGARIPLSEARLAVRFIRKHRETGWRTNGEKFSIGGYQLVQISDKEIHVGCHHITWEEFDRIAPLITIACAKGTAVDNGPHPGEHDVVQDAIEEHIRGN